MGREKDSIDEVLALTLKCTGGRYGTKFPRGFTSDELALSFHHLQLYLLSQHIVKHGTYHPVASDT
jgi:hypothetical protein